MEFEYWRKFKIEMQQNALFKRVAHTLIHFADHHYWEGKERRTLLISPNWMGNWFQITKKNFDIKNTFEIVFFLVFFGKWNGWNWLLLASIIYFGHWL